MFRLTWSRGGGCSAKGPRAHKHRARAELTGFNCGLCCFSPLTYFPHFPPLLPLNPPTLPLIATRLHCKDEREPPALSEISFFFFAFRKVRVAFQERRLHSLDLQRSIWGSEVLASVSVRLPAARGGLHLNSNVAARHEQTLFARLSWLCHIRSVTTS